MIHIAGLTIAFAIFVASAFPAYWTYKCRFEGVYCENSVLRPSESAVVAVNIAEVQNRLRKTADRGFLGFSIKKSGFLFFGTRFDVLANFDDGRQLIIDTIPDTQHDVSLWSEEQNRAAFILTYPRSPEGDPIARLRAYFADPALSLRQYELLCPIWRNFRSGPDDAIRIANLTYSKSNRQIAFTITSICPYLKTSAGTLWLRDSSLSSSIDLTERRSVTAIAALTEMLHLEWISKAEDVSRWHDAAQRHKDCVQRAASISDPIEGELFGCYIYQDKPDSRSSASLRVYQWRNGELVEIDSSHCGHLYWIKDPSRLAIFSTCFSEFKDNDKSKVSLGLSVFDGSQNEIYINFKGECEALHAYNHRFVSPGKLIRFTLVTDCTELWIGGTKYSTGFQPSDRHSELQHPFLLEISPEGLVMGFYPSDS